MPDLAVGLLDDQPAPDVAIHTEHAGMGRDQIRLVFGRHGVAGLPAEGHRIGVLPGGRDGQQDEDEKRAHAQIRERAAAGQPAFRG